MSDFLAVADLEIDELNAVLATAAEMKESPDRFSTKLAGRSVGLFFEKPSNRTRLSCEVGTVQLGAHPVVVKPDEIGMGSRESAEDVARVFDRYLDVIAMRVFDHATLMTVADHASAPVINMLSDVEHPLQALADCQTIAEHRPIDGAVVAYIGDGNNVCRSLISAVTSLGGSVRVAAPDGYGPGPGYEDLATVTADPVEAVRGADVVYTDVWVSMGESDHKRDAFNAYQVDEGLFSHASEDAIFMHCLPAHRGEEVTDEVMEHPRSRVFDQAENRMHAYKALLAHVAG